MATNDLAILSTISKGLEEKRKEYTEGDTVLLYNGANIIEATITKKIAGSGKRASMVKVHSSVALYAFSEQKPNPNMTEAAPRKDAWLSTKEWEVRALVNRPKKEN